MPKICIVIPCYRHTDKIEGVLNRLIVHGFPIIVVDDGNPQEEALALDKICANLQDVFLLHHERNRGKGRSIFTGLLFAKEHGFSHAIQIDADGQHCLEDLGKVVELINKYPQDVISGRPVYDEHAPRSRVIGRKITNFFVKLETLSNEIEDAMIGLRAYPVDLTCLYAQKCNLKFGMTFDIEILVRLKWAGTKVRFFETKIDYPKDGYSNFKPIDQFKISYIHTLLCTGMILRLPFVLLQALLKLFKSHDER